MLLIIRMPVIGGIQMHMASTTRCVPAALLRSAPALCALLSSPVAIADPPSFVQDGKAGFVVAHIEYALSHDADKTGACPDGMTKGVEDTAGGAAAGARGAGAAGMARSRRAAICECTVRRAKLPSGIG
jgi:hypothetical protein